MIVLAKRSPRIVFVDPRPGDYEKLVFDWQAHQLPQDRTSCQFLTSAREALRLDVQDSMTLWIVNTKLPDIDGFDLCEMLQQRSDHSVVWIVSDGHSIQEEVKAYCTGASTYLCKPLESAWLKEWQEKTEELGV